MLARLQQAITIGLVVLASVWAACFLVAGRPWWALAGAGLILFGYAAFLAVEFVMLACVRSGDPAPRARAGQLLRAWWGEVTHSPRVFCWRQPFRSHAVPDHLPADARGRRGCLLVHGFVCNRGFWTPWMKRLRDAGVPFVAVDLEPVFGSIDAYVDVLTAAANRIEAATGMPPVVVAHSMGGLAVRHWLARTGTQVDRVVTIGTPHRGTWLARFSMTANGHQMRIGAAGRGWLRWRHGKAKAMNASPASSATATTSSSRRRRRRCPAPTTATCPAAPMCTWPSSRPSSTPC